jgi:phytoene desaturase
MVTSTVKNIVVIGSGFAGLSAASSLAHAGHRVIVLEKNSSPGGRARILESQGYRFDLGPSWYWMPDVFEKFFNRFGSPASDFYSLQRLDPSYRVFFSASEIVDIPAEIEGIYPYFEEQEKGSAQRLKSYLDEAKYKYDVGINRMVYNPGISIKELFDSSLVAGLFKLHLFKSISSHLKDHFRDPKLIRLLQFPTLFLGAPPSETPALYSLMNYADMKLGTWYPRGGIYGVVQGMVSLAKKLGVDFKFNSPVTGFEFEDRHIRSVRVHGDVVPCDAVLATADYHHVEQELLTPERRQYSERYWEQRTMSPSCLLFYLGISSPLKNLLHHNLFLEDDLEKHLHSIYIRKEWPPNPSFYVCCPSKTDSTTAPAGHENLFLLIPLASGLNDSPAEREKCFHKVLSKLETYTRQPIRDHIDFKQSYAHSNFLEDYHAYKGNAYGLAATWKQTANFRPSITSKKIPNLFFAGHLTIPGPGIPPAVISGQVVADQLIKQINSNRFQFVK